MKRRAVIIDMDNTICENVTNRPWYGPGAASGMTKDAPRLDLINMIRSYCNKYDIDILILTGRHSGSEEQVTLEWLDRYWIYPSNIYTRDLEDFSKAEVYKEKVYSDKIEPVYDVLMVFEDDPKCVEMFENKGLLVLQPHKI